MRNLRKIASLMTITLLLLVFSTAAFASGSEVKFSGDIHVGVDETKAGDVVGFGGEIIVDGTVNGDVVSIGGDVTINGTVSGDVVVIGGTLTRGASATIRGEIVEIGSGSFSLGDLSALNISFGFNKTAWALTSLLITVILSLLVVVIMPRGIENMANYLPNKTGKVVLSGLIGILAFPVLLILCMLSIILLIGLLLTPLLILVYVVIGYIGNVAVSLFIGKRLSKLFNQENLPMAVQMLMGLVVLWGARNVPFIGGWIGFALLFVNIGLVLASKFGRNTIEPPTSTTTVS